MVVAKTQYSNMENPAKNHIGILFLVDAKFFTT